MDGATGSAPRAPISLTAAERDALLRLLQPAVHCDDADCPLEDPLSALVDATRERLEGNTLEETASTNSTHREQASLRAFSPPSAPLLSCAFSTTH